VIIITSNYNIFFELEMDEIRKSSEEAWEKLKSDMDSIMEDLEDKIKEILSFE